MARNTGSNGRRGFQHKPAGLCLSHKATLCAHSKGRAGSPWPQEGDVEVATGAFIIRDGKLFLASGPKFHNQWVVPGGHVEYRETIQKCVEREVKEETNAEVKATELICVSEDLHKKVNGKERHFVFLNWKCELVNGEPKIDGKEFTKFIWMPLKEALANDNIADSLKEPLKKLVAEKE